MIMPPSADSIVAVRVVGQSPHVPGLLTVVPQISLLK